MIAAALLRRCRRRRVPVPPISRHRDLSFVKPSSSENSVSSSWRTASSASRSSSNEVEEEEEETEEDKEDLSQLSIMDRRARVRRARNMRAVPLVEEIARFDDARKTHLFVDGDSFSNKHKESVARRYKRATKPKVVTIVGNAQAALTKHSIELQEKGCAGVVEVRVPTLPEAADDRIFAM